MGKYESNVALPFTILAAEEQLLHLEHRMYGNYYVCIHISFGK